MPEAPANIVYELYDKDRSEKFQSGETTEDTDLRLFILGAFYAAQWMTLTTDEKRTRHESNLLALAEALEDLTPSGTYTPKEMVALVDSLWTMALAKWTPSKELS